MVEESVQFQLAAETNSMTQASATRTAKKDSTELARCAGRAVVRVTLTTELLAISSQASTSRHHMVEESVQFQLIAVPEDNTTPDCATQFANLSSTELDQSAGRPVRITPLSTVEQLAEAAQKFALRKFSIWSRPLLI